MIPQTIQLKNFLSYGPELQTIHLEPYHLIYLSGKNGHGKSALLDAITWALWGQARKVTAAVKSDQGLLRLGQTQMLVVVDFLLNDCLYRVRREFSLNYGKPTTQLDFGTVNPTTDEFVPLTDKTIKATQLVIDKTVRLDYHAFINSAFLRQGNANEFSRKSPKERKEILCSILGLDLFDTIKKKALEKARQIAADKNSLVTLLEKNNEKLTHKPELIKQLQEVEKNYKQLEAQETKQHKKQKEHETNQHKFHEQQKKYELLVFRHEQLHKQIKDNRLKIKECVMQWRSVHAQHIASQSIETVLAQRTTLAQKIDAMQKTIQRQVEFKTELLKTQEAMHARTALLTQQHANACTTIKQSYEQKSAQATHYIALLSQLKEKKKALALPKEPTESDIPSVQKKLITMQHQFEARKEAYQRFCAQAQYIHQESSTFSAKTAMVKSTNPSCPLCEQNLSVARKKFLASRFAKQEKQQLHQYQRLLRVTKKLKEILIAQHAQIEQLKDKGATLAQWFTIDQEEKQQQQNLSVCQKECTALQATLTKHQKELEQIIEKDTPISTLQTQQKEIHKKLAAISYNEKEHAAVQKEYAAIEKKLIAFEKIKQEHAQQTMRQKNIADLISVTRVLQKDKSMLQTQLEPFKNLANQEKTLAQEAHTLSQATQEIKNHKEQIIKEQSHLQTVINQLEQLAKENEQQGKKVDQLTNEAHEYQQVAHATGKDGIQALLIEETIPEIEHEANALLNQLTNNQSHVMFESLRDLKKGGSKETLDIKISDASGIRPYEMFSGGEAFRIDFAIRIALSKLLARRAGTSLQTLIIDEGFGSQDEEGLSHIMEALHTIQDDFEKIIIVSHLPSMKDQFPVHFAVEKLPTGSTIRVIEHA